jgi:hypothetical protein
VIENFDPAVYSRFADNNNGSSTVSSNGTNNNTSSNDNLSLLSSASKPHNMLKRMDSVHAKSKKNFYILSMGHRIQFLKFDDNGVC